MQFDILYYGHVDDLPPSCRDLPFFLHQTIGVLSCTGRLVCFLAPTVCRFSCTRRLVCFLAPDDWCAFLHQTIGVLSCNRRLACFLAPTVCRLSCTKRLVRFLAPDDWCAFLHQTIGVLSCTGRLVFVMHQTIGVLRTCMKQVRTVHKNMKYYKAKQVKVHFLFIYLHFRPFLVNKRSVGREKTQNGLRGQCEFPCAHLPRSRRGGSCARPSQGIVPARLQVQKAVCASPPKS